MIINSFAGLPDLFSEKKIGLDIETHDPNLKKLGPGAIRNDGRIVGIGLVPVNGEGWYIPESLIVEKHKLIDWFSQHKFDYIYGQNILYDLEWLACYGIRLHPKYFIDSMFAEGVLEPSAKKDLDTLAGKYLKDAKKSNEIKNYITKVLGKPEKEWKGCIHLAPKELAGPYCLKDAKLSMDVFRKQKELLQRDGLLDVFLKECSLIPILLAMKLQGVRVNQHKIKDYYHLINDEIISAKKPLDNLNVNSHKEVSIYLKKKGFKLDFTLQGNDSVTSEWLQLNGKDPDVSAISRLRKLLKLSSTFVEPYLDRERLHTQYHTLKGEYGLSGAVTGRFSSSNPNLQNIPARENEFKEIIRGFFEPEEECDWYSFDYSQIEYRLVVNFGKGLNGIKLRSQYISDKSTDFHKVVMDWTCLPRKEAKVANFLLVYGGWYPRLQQQLRCEEIKAIEIYNLYHATFPTIRHTFFYYRKMARLQNGEIRTIWNRRRTLKMPQQERLALNTFIQGSAADIMKEAMIDLHKKGIYDTIGYPLLTVHDELSFSLPKDVKKEVIVEIKETMENVGKKYLTVPLLVNVEMGENWGHLNTYTKGIR